MHVVGQDRGAGRSARAGDNPVVRAESGEAAASQAIEGLDASDDLLESSAGAGGVGGSRWGGAGGGGAGTARSAGAQPGAVGRGVSGVAASGFCRGVVVEKLRQQQTVLIV